jgi:hypothetical protein
MPSWYLTLERRAPEIPSSNLDWHSLSKFEPQLRSLAESQGVKPLLEFFSCGPDDLPEKVSVSITEHWFAPKDALKTVSALLHHLRAPDNQLMRDEGVTQELEEFERILEALDSKGVKFHIAIDY